MLPLWTVGAAALHPGVLYAACACFLVAMLLLFKGRPSDRLWTLRTFALFGAALLVVWLGHDYVLARAAGYMLEGLAFIAILGRLIVDVVMPRVGVRAPLIMRDLLVAFASGVFILVRLHEEGVVITALITTSAVLTVTLGIALQDTLGNLLGGLSLQMDDSLDVGDWIRHDGVTGRVTSMTWRHTSFHTNNGETFVVPNSVLVKNKFAVIGRESAVGKVWRRQLVIPIDDDVQPTLVLETLDRALSECEIPHLMGEPRPSVILLELELGVAKYQVRYWLDDFAHDDATDSAVRIHLYYALRRAEISLAAPVSQVEYARRGARPTSFVGQADLHAVKTLLGEMDIFKALTDEERAQLASRIRLAPFAKGDVITRQGAEAHWLYIVAEGEVRVVWRAPDGKKHPVAEIGARDFFGEMGLLTGETRTATIIAKTDVVCWRLDRIAFLGILQARPALAEAIAHVLTRRRNELEALRNAAAHEAPPEKHKQSEMLARIRTFFNLNQ